jgi:hypothetical protein
MKQNITDVMEVIHGYKFVGGLLFEVKFTDVPKSEPKNKRYSWYIYEKNQLSELTFEKFEKEIRYFVGDTVIDIGKYVLRHNDYILPFEKVGKRHKEFIINYLLPKLKKDVVYDKEC